jgi:hypothetical protein
LERQNASSSGEKIRMATIPGQTLERGKGRTKSPRQSKNKTAIGKSTKSIAIKWWRIRHHFMERSPISLIQRFSSG